MLHFSRAAEKLGVTQPLLSEQIKALEYHVGVKLLDRTSRRVTLTPAGQVFADRARLIIQALEDAVCVAREAGDNIFSRIRIGYTDEFTSMLPGLVEHVKKAEPASVIELNSLMVPQLLQALQSGTADLALACPLPERLMDDELNYLVLPPLPLSVGLSSGHPLATAESLTIADIADEDFLEAPLEPPSASEAVVDRLFAHEGLKRRIVQRFDNGPLGLNFAAAGLGILIADLQNAIVPPGLTVVPLDAPNAILTRGAIWRRSLNMRLLEVCKAHLEEEVLGSPAERE